MADTSRPDHLPNLRADRQPPHPSWLPRQRRGITPQMIGRYPDYDVLDTVDTWDEATKKVVLARLDSPAPLRFFTAEEEPTLRAFCDVLLAQDHEPRVPVAEFIDDKLAGGRLDGYQYADMPDDRDTWRMVLRGLDEVAADRYGKASFADAEPGTQLAIVEQFSRSELNEQTWSQLNTSRAWSVCMRMALSGFYSHPWAWNEIGFGGPAYPRGFMRLGGSAGNAAAREPLETRGATDEDPVQTVEEDKL
jgi:hypothetical protein